jgi:hypothetical protein
MQSKVGKISDRLKKLAEKKEKLKFQEQLLHQKSRKQKTKRMIEIGSIAANFGIDAFDNSTIAGAFAEIHEKFQQPNCVENWRKKGEALSKKSRLPLLVSFGKEPSDDVKMALKSQRFKWNSMRKEWQGYGIKDEIEKLIQEFHGKAEVASG